jgi:cation diffusion facilitator CzcD-associated flavoprotein CzcO
MAPPHARSDLLMDIAAAPTDTAELAALERRLRHDLACLNIPPANWVVPHTAPDGGTATDVVVIGGGMCGLAAAFALIRRGVRNLRILDRSPAGQEGPWITYARMETLRSPKDLVGPASGLGPLTFRAYYEARFGLPAWEALFRIPRPIWMEYLVWYRRVLDLKVENGVTLDRIVPEAGLLRLETQGTAPFYARKVVLATGRAGLGGPQIPDFARGLSRRFWAHSADDIDFAALRGRKVVVIGGSASAMDNAAEALEHGAESVRLLIRRPVMPRINRLMGIGSFGFTAGFPRLSDAERWRIMNYAERQQTPAPRNSTLRVSRHPNASFHLGSAIESVEQTECGLRITTSRKKTFAADFMILGTGFTVDPVGRPELAPVSADIALWSDRFTPPPDQASPELAGYPYLTESFAFQPRIPGTAPWLADIHCFNNAASLTMGKVSGDIPKISEGATWLAEAICGEFFTRDLDRHWTILENFSRAELLGDEWTDAEAEQELPP